MTVRNSHTDRTRKGDEGSDVKDKAGVGERVLKGSFWLIAAIHITIFTITGVTTKQWRLLIIFLVGFVLVMTIYALIKVWRTKAKRRRTIS